MSQALSEYIELNTTDSIIDDSRFIITKLGLKLNRDKLRDLCDNDGLRNLSVCLDSAWVYLPRPPSNLNPVDIVVLLLSSTSYTMSPSTFNWEGSDHSTYQSIWKLVLRTASINPGSDFALPYIMSRSASGYNSFHNIATHVTSNYHTIEDYDHELYLELLTLSRCPEVGYTDQLSYVTVMHESIMFSISELFIA